MAKRLWLSIVLLSAAALSIIYVCAPAWLCAGLNCRAKPVHRFETGKGHGQLAQSQSARCGEPDAKSSRDIEELYFSHTGIVIRVTRHGDRP